MGYYEYATICLNGHEISGTKANAQPHCEECGAKTISNCQCCGEPIHGKYQADGVVMIGFRYTKPYYCWSCGEPYPWTEKILKNAVEILSLDETLNERDKEMIKASIPNLIVETPDSPIAVAKYKSGVAKAEEFVKESLRQLLIDVVSETIRRALF